VPDRINNLRPTIRSLLKQTRPPDEIILAIPEFSIREKRSYVVPEYLLRLPRVRILHCVKDWGPATKFIPVIQEELAAGRRSSLIMVVDDDRIYPRNALETYLYFSKQLPEAALCFRGAAMPQSLDWRDAKMIRGSELRQPQPAAVITGCGSYFIQPRFFDETLWDYSNAPNGAFYMDDIWISGWLSRRRVKRYVVPASAMMGSVFRQRRTLSLHDVPEGRQYHNNETIAFFGDTWDVFASD
jgi:glycosyltransferase involved in cell wall biosynthesis